MEAVLQDCWKTDSEAEAWASTLVIGDIVLHPAHFNKHKRCLPNGDGMEEWQIIKCENKSLVLRNKAQTNASFDKKIRLRNAFILRPLNHSVNSKNINQSESIDYTSSVIPFPPIYRSTTKKSNPTAMATNFLQIQKNHKHKKQKTHSKLKVKVKLTNTNTKSRMKGIIKKQKHSNHTLKLNTLKMRRLFIQIQNKKAQAQAQAHFKILPFPPKTKKNSDSNPEQNKKLTFQTKTFKMIRTGTRSRRKQSTAARARNMFNTRQPNPNGQRRKPSISTSIKQLQFISHELYSQSRLETVDKSKLKEFSGIVDNIVLDLSTINCT